MCSLNTLWFFHMYLTNINHKERSKSMHLYFPVITSLLQSRSSTLHKSQKSSGTTFNGPPRVHWFPVSSFAISLQEITAFLDLFISCLLRTWSTYIHLLSILFQDVIPRYSNILDVVSCSTLTKTYPSWSKNTNDGEHQFLKGFLSGRQHRWELPVIHYLKIMAIYPYPLLVVITQLFSWIIFINDCICILTGSPG